jgi:hypothetical protein
MRCACSAVQAHGEAPHAPSVFERERFCRTRVAFVSCRTFVAHSLKQAPLSEDEYYALWWPEETTTHALP